MQRTERTVRELITEFRVAVSKLEKLKTERLKEVITQCCEVSRDIRLFAGAPNEVSDGLRDQIRDVFANAVEILDRRRQELQEIDQAQPAGEPRLMEYRENIAYRAGLFGAAVAESVTR